MRSRHSSTHAALWRLVATAGLLVIAACSFDTRSEELACKNQSDCSDGRECSGGWCVNPNATPDASDIDGSDGTDGGSPMDAGPGADAEVLCGNDVCGDGETETNCPADCTVCSTCAGGQCTETCGNGGDCVPRCEGDGCACTYDCTNTDRCRPRCDGNVTCTTDCTDGNRCDRMRCTNGAQCIVTCTDANRCSFNECTGGSGEQSCANDIIVCNRDCP